MLGVSFAYEYVPASVVTPSAYAMAAIRRKPVTRDSIVPTATTALERISDGCARAAARVAGRVMCGRSCRLGGGGADRAWAWRGPSPAAATADVEAPPDPEEDDGADGDEEPDAAHERRPDLDACLLDRHAVGRRHGEHQRERSRRARLDREA